MRSGSQSDDPADAVRPRTGCIHCALYIAVAMTAFIAGWLALWHSWGARTGELISQEAQLYVVVKEVVAYRAPAARVVERVREFAPDASYLEGRASTAHRIVVPTDRDWGRRGGWALHFRLDDEGRCNQAWLEFGDQD